jgi:hypothetical protein
MAILLREVGVPTRNVTGFSAAHFNSYGRYWAVRSGDAHAWVEAYLPGEGWTTFDPTPPSDATPNAADALFAEMRALSDALRARWEEWIIGYDLRSQRNLARSLGQWLGGGSSTGTRGVDGAPERPWSPWRAAGVVLLLIALGILADRAYRALLRRGRAPTEREIDANAREIVAIYRELEQEMLRLGMPRAAHVTPLSHAQELTSRDAPGAEIVMKVTRRYVEARFGGVRPSEAELRALRGSVRMLRSIPSPARAAA